jgi:hypothetical protein
MRSSSGDPKAVLQGLLRQAGLAGRVRVAAGVPVARGARRPRSLDARLGIGAPVRALQGQLVELVGAVSSGRTALAYRLAADAVARGELVAWVDLPRALDALHLARSGAALDCVLWVQPPRLAAALQAAELLLRTGFAATVLDVEGASRAELARLGAGVWLRLLRAAREQRATLIALAPERCTGAGATLALCAEQYRARFERGLFEGFESRVHVLRDRSGALGEVHELAARLRACSRS